MVQLSFTAHELSMEEPSTQIHVIPHKQFLLLRQSKASWSGTRKKKRELHSMSKNSRLIYAIY